MLTRKTTVAALLALASAAQAQTPACDCNSGGARIVDTALVTLLSNRMACASVGGEVWQEWHNGATAAGGPLVDYKLGPSNPVDPSSVVGSYAITGSGSTSAVSYTYGSSTYKYDVCRVGSNFTFCGAKYGGRDITNAVIGGSGLQSCAALTSTSAAKARRSARSEDRGGVRNAP